MRDPWEDKLERDLDIERWRGASGGLLIAVSLFGIVGSVRGVFGEPAVVVPFGLVFLLVGLARIARRSS